MGLGKRATYFECINIHRIDLVYAQAKGHNEQQGFPGWTEGRGALTLVTSSQRIKGVLISCVSTQGKDTAHFF
jgi:hypothetical protein